MWARFDDAFADEPAIAGLSDAGFRRFVEAVLYFSRVLSDGFVPRRFTLGHESAAAEILAAGLWAEAAEGFRVVDFERFSPLREVVEAERSRRREFHSAGGRARAARAARVGGRFTSESANSDQHGDQHATSPVPVPVPVPVNESPPIPPAGAGGRVSRRERQEARALVGKSTPRLEAPLARAVDKSAPEWVRALQEREDRGERLSTERSPDGLPEASALALWKNGADFDSDPTGTRPARETA
jgi:hypothetical protein